MAVDAVAETDTDSLQGVAIEIACLAVWRAAPRRTKLTDEQVSLSLLAEASALSLEKGTTATDHWKLPGILFPFRDEWNRQNTYRIYQNIFIDWHLSEI